MTPDERWLAAMWSRIERYLPEPPAAVVDLGCGPLGGFVPMLRAAGYDALGVDPKAPEGPDYRQVPFEQCDLPRRPQAVVASTSLHHVEDPARLLDRLAMLLTPDGSIVVVEWDWEGVDEATARWCFERLDPSAEHGWLAHHRDRWSASGQPWDTYVRDWAAEEGLHSPKSLLQALDRSFERCVYDKGPYFFPHLTGVSEEDERAAIEAGAIRAARIEYVGHPRT